jgi:hypothetical protein
VVTHSATMPIIFVYGDLRLLLIHSIYCAHRAFQLLFHAVRAYAEFMRYM